MYTKINERQLQAPNQSTDFLDISCVMTLSTSGAALTLANIIVQGQPVCEDVTSLLTNNTTTPVPEQAVAVFNASAGPPLGIYQGSTLTNASTSATSTAAIIVRRWGYGVIAAGGATISPVVGGVLTVAPITQTTRTAIQATPVFGNLISGTTFYVGAAMATLTTTTVGGVLQTVGATTFGVYNALICCNG